MPIAFDLAITDFFTSSNSLEIIFFASWEMVWLWNWRPLTIQVEHISLFSSKQNIPVNRVSGYDKHFLEFLAIFWKGYISLNGTIHFHTFQ